MADYLAQDKEPGQWLIELTRAHDAELPELKALNDEYELRSPNVYMHPEILREVGDRLRQVVIAWPQLVVDSLEERLDVEGFRLPDATSGDDEMWRVWQENNCDEESQLAHIDALSMKRAYIAVGANEDDESTPLVTYESPLEVYADIDPRTRRVRAALRRWSEYTGSDALARPVERHATLYLPDRTIYYSAVAGNDYAEQDVDMHGLGVVPVVPLVNRGRLADRRGRSELSAVLPLTHAANKSATDMMVASEFVALPLRGFLGVGPDAFEDANGNKMTALQAILGRMLMIPEGETGAGDAVKQFEFAAAQLKNFTDVLTELAQLVASIAGLPPHYLGQSTDNPASADAIRSNEARLVKRAERRQRAFGGAHELSMRIVGRLQAGDWDPSLKRLETVWRNASTPTTAQSADAALKLFNLPTPIVPLRQTRQDLGYTDAQIALMEDQDALHEAQQAAMFDQQTAAAGQPGKEPAGAGAGTA